MANENQYFEFLKSYAFTSDPFEHTNADQEPQLSDYFVPPPYFESVLGDPKSPKSQVILAPRGGGKSAQRRMVEIASQKSTDFLCITYDSFDISTEIEANQVRLSFHLTNINRRLLIALLALAEANVNLVKKLDKRQRANIARFAKEYFDGMTADDFKTGLDSIKSLGLKTRELWNKAGSTVIGLIGLALKIFGVAALTPKTADQPEEAINGTASLHFKELLAAVQSFGYLSTYILVDKIDETAASNTPTTAFALIRPLILDLGILEVKNCAFKFFLWDVIASPYKTAGARTDRIPLINLEWSQDELAKMLSKRMLVQSAYKVDSFNMLCDARLNLDVHRLLPAFAQGSPRDMIRLSKRIISEHTRAGAASGKISIQSIEEGLRVFSSERAAELYEDAAQELRKVQRPAFTINQLASDVYRVSAQAARARVQSWLEKGFIKKIGEIPNRINRPLHLYGVHDPRLAVAMIPKFKMSDHLEKTLYVCDACNHLALAHLDRVHCTRCEQEVEIGSAKSFLESCRKKS